MRTRRELLRSGSTFAVAALPGCASRTYSGQPETAENTESPPTDSTETTETGTSDSTVIDIREYGAELDGETDDTAAINDAIEDAEAGDTVFFPPGTIRVRSEKGGAILVDDSVPDGVTLLGGGEETVIEMLDVDDESNQWCLGVRRDKPVKELEIRNMRISGNKAANGNKSAFGINIKDVEYGESGHDILIEDVETFDCAGRGIGVRVGNVELNRVTSRGNTRHGINPMLDRELPEGEWSFHARNVLCENNGGTGIDHNRGSAKFERFWLENNASGNKVTREAKESWWSNGRFVDNGHAGFRYNGPIEKQTHTPMHLHLDNLVSEGSQRSGFYLGGDVQYDIGTIVARGNNAGDEGRSNVQMIAKAVIDADEIYATNAVNGHGLFYYSDEESRIGLYQHSGNPKGGFDGKESNVAIERTAEGRAPSLDVPDKTEVGADFTPASELSLA